MEDTFLVAYIFCFYSVPINKEQGARLQMVQKEYDIQYGLLKKLETQRSPATFILMLKPLEAVLLLTPPYSMYKKTNALIHITLWLSEPYLN